MKTLKIVPNYLIFTLFLLLLTYPALSAEKAKIGIMEFDVAKNLDPAFGGFLYDMLLERMVASGKYTVVDWEEIDRVLKYVSQSQPNISDEDARKQAVDQLGIEKMYLGSITKIAGKFYITVKVLNLDLTVEKVQKGSTKSEGGLETIINEIADSLLGLKKESEEQQAVGKAQSGRLFVETEPDGARIKILNIKPKFYQGMELEPGRYNVEVSASDYETQNVWVALSADERKTLTIRLTGETERHDLRHAIGLFTGTAGQVDEEKAKKLFLKASENGDPLAEMWVAFCHFCGLCSFSKNEVLAKEEAKRVIKQIKSLANDGNSEAMFLLAIAYKEGLAIFQDDIKAVYWYLNAAEKGHATAMTNLGWMYQEGKGVTKNDTLAAYWWQKAAEKNHAYGIYNLGTVYENGAGVAKDKERAVSLYRKASEKGFYLARKRLKELGY